MRSIFFSSLLLLRHCRPASNQPGVPHLPHDNTAQIPNQSTTRDWPFSTIDEWLGKHGGPTSAKSPLTVETALWIQTICTSQHFHQTVEPCFFKATVHLFFSPRRGKTLLTSSLVQRTLDTSDVTPVAHFPRHICVSGGSRCPENLPKLLQLLAV